MAADHMRALDALEDHCHREPGAVLGRLLARLRERPDAVALALKGTSLYVRLSVLDPRPAVGWVVFTGDGHVGVLGNEAMRAEPTAAPDVLLQGPARSVLAAVLGVMEAGAALDAGVLVPMVPKDRIEPLRLLVGGELVAVAADYTES